jgi:hypothetical protein
MAAALDFEADQFLKLLTDALRAGPGSPEWHEAILRLDAGGKGAAGVDEYRVLCDARAYLESGKEYRAVRAGPGFARAVMQAIDTQEMVRPRRFTTATVIAWVAGILLAGTVAAIVYLLAVGGSHTGAQSEAIEALASKLLGNSVASLTFDSQPSSQWKIVGNLPLEFGGGMRGKRTMASANTINTGGLLWKSPMSADTPFEVEAVLKVIHSTDDLLPEVAISDTDDFSAANATSSHELVWLLQAGEATVVLPSGRMDAQSDLGKGPIASVTVRMRVDQQNGIVEVNGKRIWSGSTGLALDKPRYVAIRLVRRGGDKSDQLSFQSVRVLTGD